MPPTAAARAKHALRTAESHVRRGNDPLWRYVFNAPAVVRHRRARPELGQEATRCLADLRRDGVATTSLEALTGDRDLLGRLQALAGDLEEGQQAVREQQERQLREGQVLADKDKVFVVQLLGARRPVLDPADLLARTALDPQLQGVVDEYFGLATRVSDVNVWRNLPSGAAPVSSQRWHRDTAEDRMVVKAFVYLEPVTEASGPFRYAQSTQPGGSAAVSVPSEFDGVNHRVPDGPESALLDARERVFTGPAGTVVIADTLGYHRGGWATSASRLAVQVRYSSLAATGNTRLGTPSSLSSQQRRQWRHRLAYDSRVTGPSLSQRMSAGASSP